MSKNFKADLSAVADEVPNHLDLDAGALTQRVARGQRRRKVTSGALAVLLVAGIGVGGYAVLDTLNHDSGPAAPLTSEPQILLDRPGVGDYNPVCGAVWDPPAPDEDDPFAQHGARLALGDVGIIVPAIRTTDPIIMSATSRFDLEVSGDQDLSIFFGEERYVYLTKDAVVVAIRPEPQGWFLPGYRLPTEQDESDEPFTAGNWFFLDLIDCNTLSGGTLESRSPVGDPLPAGEYQLHGYVPAELSSGEEILGSGNIWAGPVRVIIPEQPYWPLSDS